MEDIFTFRTRQFLRENSTMLRYAYLSYTVKIFTHYSHSHYNERVGCVHSIGAHVRAPRSGASGLISSAWRLAKTRCDADGASVGPCSERGTWLPV